MAAGHQDARYIPPRRERDRSSRRERDRSSRRGRFDSRGVVLTAVVMVMVALGIMLIYRPA
jgi:4-hydroxybenzoate polyprenyltransferase